MIPNNQEEDKVSFGEKNMIQGRKELISSCRQVKKKSYKYRLIPILLDSLTLIHPSFYGPEIRILIKIE